MDRRVFLETVAAAGITGLTGCSALTDGSDPGETGTHDDGDPVPARDASELPDGVYVPNHSSPMEMLGMQMDGGMHVMLSYTAPHEFWTVTGDHTNEAAVQSDDAMHLMVTAWDADAHLTAPDVEPTIAVYRDGEDLGEVAPWPMLSQPMGFHFGDNVAYSEQGEYRFEVSFSSSSATMPDDLADTFQQRTFEFTEEFRPADASDLETNWNEDTYGDEGALDPMSMEMGEMAMQTPQQPAFDDLPGDAPAPQYTDDAGLTVTTHDDPATLGAETDAEQYLVVPVQTRYNRYMLPNVQVAATVARDGEEVTAVDLTEGLHPDFGQYYGAGVPALEAGDEVEVEFTTPSQVTRHQGYEHAFLSHEPLTFTL